MMDVNNAEQVQPAGTLNLFQKLVEVRKSIPALHKDAKGYNYSYVTGSQILAGIQQAMNDYGVLLFPKIDTQNVESGETVSAKGKKTMQFRVHGRMTYTWINADNPNETLEVPFMYAAANEDVAKALGSALTYAERYFLIKSFNLPTDNEDPDYNRNNQSNYQQPYQQPQYRNQQPPMQQQQQQYRNQQPPMQQQQPPQQKQEQHQVNADGEKLITTEQKQKLKNALKMVAGEKAEDQQTAFESACCACNIPEGTTTKALTFAQTSAVLFYFDGLVKQRQGGV